MHFIGMLAYSIPIETQYNTTITIISVIPAIFSSLIILKTSYKTKPTSHDLFIKSILIGCGIALMHYLGMAAMHMNAIMRYDAFLFILSILIAITLARITLQLKLKADRDVTSDTVFYFKLLVPATIMGSAISAMHYTGMAAMYIFPSPNIQPSAISSNWSSNSLIIIIIFITLLLSILLVLAIEVSHRLDLYKKIKESERDLAITLNSIGDAVIATDAKGNITRMNPVAEKLTGWTINEAKNESIKTVFPIINATTRKPIESPINKILATGEIVYLSNHTTLISKNGNEYQISDSVAPIRNSENNIIGMVLVFNDVTEQYNLRQAANKSQRDMQAIMDNSPAVIYVKDLEGRFTFINQQFSDLFQISSEEILGKRLHDVFPKEVADEMQRNDIDIIKTGHALESEEIAPHENGPHTYISNKFPLFDDENNIYAICGISTDITDRRSQELQLRRSQKMDALGKLTGGIAHDYNNMLGVILGYSELLLQMVNDQPEISSFVNEIHHAGERGAKLTKKLLTFSSQQSTQNNKLQLNELLNSSKLMLEKTMTARINLILDLSDDLWSIFIDVNDLEDAILNICINAMHAIENNGKLTIQTRNEIINDHDAYHLQITAGDYVLFSLTDTGCGMNTDTKERIFDPFFSTKGEKGTGLGLSQVFGLVQRSKGAIKLYSELGHGTRFSLYFPRYITNQNEEQEIDERDELDLKGTETILIVDDEPALIKVTTHILMQQGYQCLSANNAKQALNTLNNKKIDLLLSDVIMPEMDGYELASIVQKMYPNIKIQMASGFSDDRHINMTDNSLHKKILHKPYHSISLLRRIRELLDNK